MKQFLALPPALGWPWCTCWCHFEKLDGGVVRAVHSGDQFNYRSSRKEYRIDRIGLGGASPLDPPSTEKFPVLGAPGTRGLGPPICPIESVEHIEQFLYRSYRSYRSKATLVVTCEIVGIILFVGLYCTIRAPRWSSDFTAHVPHQNKHNDT